MGYFRKAAQVTLWCRLVQHGMFRKLLHFYGALWGFALLLTVLSFVGLERWDPAAAEAYGGLAGCGLLCGICVLGGYLVGRLLGSIPVIAFCLFLPSLVLAMPETPGNPIVWAALWKGLGVFLCCIVITCVLYMLAPLPYSLVGYRGWPHRRAMSFVLLSSSCLGLWLLAQVVGDVPPFFKAAEDGLSLMLTERGWPAAICCWLWLNMAWLLSNYEAEVLPPLLRRIGMSSVPDRLSSDDGYMLEHLILELPDHPEL